MLHKLCIKKISLIIISAILCCGIFVFAQTASAAELYKRKSISRINRIWLATPSAQQIPSDKANRLFAEVRKWVEMPRFDYNKLPENLLREFEQRTRTEKDLTVKSIATLLTETVAPKIIEILEVNLELRAEEYETEEDRQKFISTKAKELGITSEDLEKVMNSAFLYLPVLTDYSRTFTTDKDTKKKTVTYKMKGGLVWFHLKVEGGKGTVEVLKDKAGKKVVAFLETSTSSSADPDEEYSLGLGLVSITAPGAKKVPGDTFAFEQTVNKFAKNLEVLTSQLWPFILEHVVKEVDGGKVGFNLGKKEGLFTDQKFRVFEKYDKGGKTKEKNKGFFVIRDIRDNRKNPNVASYGKLIIRGAEPGMQIREYPRVGVDLTPRLGAAMIKILPPDPTADEISGVNGNLNIPPEEFTATLPLVDVALQWNLARFSKIPQLFVTGGGNIGMIPTGDITIDLPSHKDQDTRAGLYWGAYVGLMKKYYIRRIALFVEPRYEYQSFSFWRAVEEDDDEESLTYSNSISLLSASAGLEFALRADLNIGITGGFRGIAKSTSTDWTEKFKKTKKKEGEEDEVITEEETEFTGPEVDYKGAFLGIYVTYSLPTLF